MNHDADPIEDEQADSKSGGSERGQKSKHDRNRCDQKKQDSANDAMAFVNMAESRNHAQQYRHRIARFRFRGFGRFQRPVAIGAGSRICRERRPAKWAFHRIPAYYLGLCRSVGVFHLELNRTGTSQEPPDSSSTVVDVVEALAAASACF